MLKRDSFKGDSELVVFSLSDEELHRLIRLYLRELFNRLEDSYHAES